MAHGTWIALAGLLHDVGKLLQRAHWGEGGGQHPSYSAQFVEQYAKLFQSAGVDPGWLQRTVQRHHEGWKSTPQYQPERPEEWCVAIADTLASKEREEASGPTSKKAPRNPLAFPLRRYLSGEGERRGGEGRPLWL